MKERKILRKVQGSPAIDGAGVRLTRVLGIGTVKDFDPFLMLDSFDSTNPDDYTKGFPTHPHRGIETITYLIQGRIEHEDSLHNKGAINSGQSQWMTAGSGILHQEMPIAAPRMLGLQLWLNLEKNEKMTAPKYFDITEDMIGKHEEDGAIIRVLSGEYKGAKGVKPPHIQATIYDVNLEKNISIEIETNPDETVFVFLIEGDAVICDETISEKTAVLFSKGDVIKINATSEKELRFIFAMARSLGEEVAWGGPIVMNTQEELKKAFDELRNGTFLK